MARAYFVAGTDTGVGKTLVTAGLLAAAAGQGHSALGLKPLAAGADAEGRNEDAIWLQQQSTLDLPYEQINPVLLTAPLAPHIAAAQEGRHLSLDRLLGFTRGSLMQAADLKLVEGAGGWRVPLNAREYLSGLPQALELPVILVVGMRLGCLNHALLTAEAIQRDGLRLAGWVASRIDPDMQAYRDNIDTLCRHMPAPLLAELPHFSHATPAGAAGILQPAVTYLLNKE